MHKFFITGATGVVGSALVAELCAQGQSSCNSDSRQRRGFSTTAGRHAELLGDSGRFRNREPNHRAEGRRHACPRFGLDDDTYRRVASGTTHIIHSAAIVKMNLPLEEARHSAVSSVKQFWNLRTVPQQWQFAKGRYRQHRRRFGLTRGSCQKNRCCMSKNFTIPMKPSKSEAERYIFANQGELPLTDSPATWSLATRKPAKLFTSKCFTTFAIFVRPPYQRFHPKDPWRELGHHSRQLRGKSDCIFDHESQCHSRPDIPPLFRSQCSHSGKRAGFEITNYFFRQYKQAPASDPCRPIPRCTAGDDMVRRRTREESAAEPAFF